MMNDLLRRLHEERLERQSRITIKRAECVDHIVWSPESYDLDVISDAGGQYCIIEELEDHRRKHHDRYLQRLHDEVKETAVYFNKNEEREIENIHKEDSISEVTREFYPNKKRSHYDILSSRSDENTSDDEEDVSSCKSIRLNDIKIEYDKTIFFDVENSSDTEETDTENNKDNSIDIDSNLRGNGKKSKIMMSNFILQQSPSKRPRK